MPQPVELLCRGGQVHPCYRHRDGVLQVISCKEIDKRCRLSKLGGMRPLLPNLPIETSEVDDTPAEFSVDPSLEVVSSIQESFEEATINSTDHEVIAAKNDFLMQCNQVKEIFKLPEINKPGFGAHVNAALTFFFVAAANAIAKALGKPGVPNEDLEKVKKKYGDLSEACKEYEAYVTKQSNEAQKRHTTFGHFVELIEKISPEVMATMNPGERLNFLMTAATISPDDIGTWLKNMSIETYDRVIGPDLRAHFLMRSEQSGDEKMDFSSVAMKSLKDALEGSKVALLRQREPISIEKLDLTSPVVPGSSTTRGQFVETLAYSLNYCLSGFEHFEDDTLSGKYKLQDQDKTMSVQEAVALGVIPQQHSYAPEARIRLLIFDFYGVEKSVKKGIDAARNILGGTSDALEQADKVVNETVARVRDEAGTNGRNEVIVPYFVGHSMGGMLAQAMAAKNNAGSLTFNPLGMGGGTIDYVGKDEVINAHASNRHMVFCSENDWLNGSMRRNVIGNQYLIPHNDPHEIGGPFNEKNREIHNNYYNHFHNYWDNRESRTVR
ncbi:MAG: hypothetical protein LBS22_04295 [Puniceicoccales bacterium]|jgi:hypothetical protein|nr:hypothetical protein [Puniceicoccales bacterium]